MQHALSEHELIAQAITLLEQGNFESAIRTLGVCIQAFPASAPGHYLMAAEMAQRQLYADALTHFQTALQLNPSLHEARLQYGLLSLAQGEVGRCLQALSDAPTAGLHPALGAYQSGLALLASDRLPEALTEIQRGLEFHHPNAALNGDMQLLATEIRARIEDQAPTANAPGADGDQDVMTRFLVSRYDKGVH